MFCGQMSKIEVKWSPGYYVINLKFITPDILY